MHIYYLFCRRNPNPIRHYLAATGCARFRHLSPVTYESLVKKSSLPSGAYIFADIELLHGDQKRRVTEIYERLTSSGDKVLLLNHPSRSLSRQPLLRLLHEQKLNDFNVYGALDDLSSVSFPVFLRQKDDHRGPQSDILNDRQALRTELERLAHGGEDLGRWLVTEFCNVRDQDGLYHKYSAFRVGEHILPRHLFFGTNWMLKHTPKDLPPECLAKERAYLKENTYADQVRRIFDAANLQYGRIDFGVVNGRVQTWEINTNPMVCTKKQFADDPRRDIHTRFLDGYHQALDDIIAAPPTVRPGIAFIPDRMRARLAAFAESRRDTPEGRFCQRVKWRWDRLRAGKKSRNT